MPGRTTKPFTLNGRPQEQATLVTPQGVKVLGEGMGTATSFMSVAEPLPMQVVPPPYRNMTDGKR